MASRDEKQLNALRSWLEAAAKQLKADISIKLWNGEIVPMGPDAKSDIVIAINSPEAIRQLMFSPKLMTIFKMYNEKLLDIEGGTPLQAMRRWDHMTAVRFARNMSKFQLLKTLSAFLFKSNAKKYDGGLTYNKKIQDKMANGRDDKDMVQWHYDISNEFYALFLDPEMTYTCAYFETADVSLADAQIAKYEMSCRRLRLKAGDKLFDIGCGWGGFVCYAAQHYGVEAYGVTLSQEQCNYAQDKIKKLGLEDRVKVELRDYREVDTAEAFDKISIFGVSEHFGIDNHDMHFKHVHKILKPEGLYLHHAVTRMAIPKIEDFRKETPYAAVMRKYIFPGTELDHIGMTVTNLERHKFNVHEVEGWREHYQLTLEHWLQRLWDNKEAAYAEVGEEKARLWILYFSLFAAGFERNVTSIFQTLASKRVAGPSNIPLSRNDLYAK